MSDLYSNAYNPDVLSCLANLSSDEVFTPPHIVNQMLDMLPQELFRDKNTKFLDPATKSGVFLREIAKRLLEGLKDEIPDLQDRIDHVFHNQLYGIAVTEMTSLLSRRSVYCSKYPHSKYSISTFDNAVGNIRFKSKNHDWKNGKCSFCSANESEYGRNIELENYAYEFIHTTKPEEILKMKFDVIIGNPPYHISTGGGQAQAVPLYDKFVTNAMSLKPKYLTMIIPARWYSGGFPAIRRFKEKFIEGNHLKVIHDFTDSSECFPGVEIKGGVCYFLWDRDYSGDCQFFNHIPNEVISVRIRPLLENGCDTVIRYNEAIEILHKVKSLKEQSFASILTSLWPFTINSSFETLSDEKMKSDDLYAYVMKKEGWIRKSEITKNLELVNSHKIFIPRSIGSADSKTDRVKPIYGGPNTVCSGTYIIGGPFSSSIEANNVISYVNTRFFHFLLSLIKITQDTGKGVYEFIPIQPFDKAWSDEDLFKKYNLTKQEIAYINSMVWPNKE